MTEMRGTWRTLGCAECVVPLEDDALAHVSIATRAVGPIPAGQTVSAPYCSVVRWFVQGKHPNVDG